MNLSQARRSFSGPFHWSPCVAHCLSGELSNDQLQSIACVSRGGTFPVDGSNCGTDSNSDGVADRYAFFFDVDDADLNHRKEVLLHTLVQWTVISNSPDLTNA